MLTVGLDLDKKGREGGIEIDCYNMKFCLL